MLGEFLRAEVQRRWAALAALALLFAAMPVLHAVRLVRVDERWFAFRYVETSILTNVLFWGLVLGSAAWGFDTWSPERRSGWVYVLSLPVPRVRMFMAKYVSGLVTIGAAVGVLAVASFAAAAVVREPAGFYAYPGTYTAWIALPCLFLYSLGFVLGARSSRTAAALILVLGFAAAGLAVFSRDSDPLSREMGWRRDPTNPVGILAQSPRLFDY